MSRRRTFLAFGAAIFTGAVIGVDPYLIFPWAVAVALGGDLLWRSDGAP